jgi:flagellar protein FlbD
MRFPFERPGLLLAVWNRRIWPVLRRGPYGLYGGAFSVLLRTVLFDLIKSLSVLHSQPIRIAKVDAMIELTRLNGRTMMLNSDLIKTAEASPDTMLTLINGEKLIVREEIGEVVERVVAYRARLLAVVARRVQHFKELERAAGLAGVDVASLPTQPTSSIGGKK